MPQVTGSIPNLINGISQQATPLRLPSQADSSDNFYPSTSESLVPRPRTDHLTYITDTLDPDAYVHLIHRDDAERYLVAVLPGGQIRVWGYDGVERVVHDESDGTYLLGVTPKDDLRVLTAFDYTFITNKTVVVQEGLTFEAERPYEALVNVQAGNYGKAYRIFINGTEQSSVLTPDGGDSSHSGYIDTAFIAQNLRTGLLAPVGDGPVGGGSTGTTGAGGGDYYGTAFCISAPWVTGRYNNVIFLENPSVDFSISVEDGYSGKAMVAIKKTIQSFSDLPSRGPDGFVVEVQGSDATGFDNYWVKFTESDEVIHTGVWKECVKPGTRLGFRGTTAPHVLVRESDGTFTFKPAPWEDRKCGDDEKNPDPSFVGAPIESVAFFKNRLVILTRENACLSASSRDGYWRYYQGSLTALLDTDPIDTASNHHKITKLRHAVAHQGELLLFSDDTQFLLKGNEVLTPKTANNSVLTELMAVRACPPVSVGASLYVPGESGDWGGIFEYYLDKNMETADYNDVTAHVPAFIPAGIRKIVANPNLSLIFVLTDGDPSSLYVYKFFYNGQEKLQSAWQRWTFPGVTDIFDIAWENHLLRVALQRPDGVFVESLQCGVGIRDVGLDFQVRLDRAVSPTGTVIGDHYQTTYTLPYDVPEGMVAVSAQGESLAWSAVGRVVTIFGTPGEVRFGVPFTARHRLSTIYNRDPKDGKTSMTNGKLVLSRLSLAYAKAYAFRVEVTPEGRPMRTYPFWSVGGSTGHLSIPIASRNDRVTIDIVVDTFRPASFVSARWNGTWDAYNRQG